MVETVIYFYYKFHYIKSYLEVKIAPYRQRVIMLLTNFRISTCFFTLIFTRFPCISINEIIFAKNAN